MSAGHECDASGSSITFSRSATSGLCRGCETETETVDDPYADWGGPVLCWACGHDVGHRRGCEAVALGEAS